MPNNFTSSTKTVMQFYSVAYFSAYFLAYYQEYQAFESFMNPSFFGPYVHRHHICSSWPVMVMKLRRIHQPINILNKLPCSGYRSQNPWAHTGFLLANGYLYHFEENFIAFFNVTDQWLLCLVIKKSQNTFQFPVLKDWVRVQRHSVLAEVLLTKSSKAPWPVRQKRLNWFTCLASTINNAKDFNKSNWLFSSNLCRYRAGGRKAENWYCQQYHEESHTS